MLSNKNFGSKKVYNMISSKWDITFLRKYASKINKKWSTVLLWLHHYWKFTSNRIYESDYNIMIVNFDAVQ